jgi:predicted phage tail protein
MLTNVHLYGSLAEKYGSSHKFDIVNAPQAVRALSVGYKGFERDFVEGEYHIKIGNHYIGEDALRLRLGAGRDVHVIPVIHGGKRSGGLKAIAGIAILAVATGGAAAAIGPFAAGASGFSATAFSVGGFAVSYGSLASTGLSMLLGGLSGLLTPVPKSGDYNNRNPVDQQASFLFNGATNRSAEGTAIPLVYGRHKCGSVVASAGMVVEQLLSQ